MKNDLYHSLLATDQKAQYDNCAKRLMAQKIILAHVLVRTLDEFKGLNPEDAVSYIEGEPYIDSIPIEPGLTNTNKSIYTDHDKIIGMNTENSEIYEGMVRFDIIFYVRTMNGRSRIIVNLEIQKSTDTGYSILNRSLFYVSRIVSSQKERDFTGSNYDDIKDTVSIWICLNMQTNCMNHIHLVSDQLIAAHDWRGNLDMINIFLIGINNELPEQSDEYSLHRLLGTLLTDTPTLKEKFDIINNEYRIKLTDDLTEEMESMCNLGEGIEERGIAKGLKQGIEQGTRDIIINMYDNQFTIEQISVVTKKTADEVKEIINNRLLASV